MNEYLKLNYCTKCVMPETIEGNKFDKKGECITCQAQKSKQKVNWKEKRKELDKILEKAKKEKRKELDKILEKAKMEAGGYDCIVPISGGKDSVYQLHVICKEYNMKPLAITFNHGGFTTTGWYNLFNCLKEFNIDHVMLTLNDELIKKIQKESIKKIGDYCWHCHTYVSSFILQQAVAYNINLIIYGESGAEYGHQGANYNNIVKFDRDYFEKLSMKLSPEKFIKDSDITMRDLVMAKCPPVDKCEKINGIHLGNYIPWNADEQVKFIKKEYNWKGREIGGSYKDSKSQECSFEPIHEFLCYLKRGYARTSIQASQDIRERKLNKEQAWYLINKYERIEPKDLAYFLERVGMTPVEFRDAVEKLKHEKVKSIDLIADKEWRKCLEDGIPLVDRFIEMKKMEE